MIFKMIHIFLILLWEPLVSSQKNSTCLSGVCVFPVQCPAHTFSDTETSCQITKNRKGVCCTSGRNHTVFSARSSNMIHLDKNSLMQARSLGKTEYQSMMSKEDALSRANLVRKDGTPTYSHYRNSRLANSEILNEVFTLANKALEIAMVTKSAKDVHGISNKQLEFGMLQADFSEDSCKSNLICDQSKFRSIDGTCNHPVNSKWGAALTPFSKLLPPKYSDGVWKIRDSVVGNQPLPSPRLISSSLFKYDPENSHWAATLLTMAFGQFVAHDVMQTSETMFSNGSGIACCTEDGHHLQPDQLHWACLPIDIPQNDNYYSSYGQTCMNFVRSLMAPHPEECSLGYIQQMNQVTHFLDGSTIYGSNPQANAAIRQFQGGRLTMFEDFGRELLPLDNKSESCDNSKLEGPCFLSGDTRVNQMAYLVAVHTIFSREHNRIAGILQVLNPHWDDERLFQEARRIVIAEFQNIVYTDFLMTLLGGQTMQEYDLLPIQNGQYSKYDPSINPSVTSEFSTAAFRMGHSMVHNKVKTFGMREEDEMVDLPAVMFRPTRFRHREYLDELLSSLSTQPANRADVSFADALTQKLFRSGAPFGLDLVSFNLQRGRDHGLRPYNDYRKLVGLKPYISFDQFFEHGEILRNLYASVDDVDLYVGGLIETNPNVNSVVGPTFSEIIAEQFSRLKKGDRYFFTNGPEDNPGFFTPEQLQQILKSSMARLICDNSDGVLLSRQTINPFVNPELVSPFYDCKSDEIPRLDLRPWKE